MCSECVVGIYHIRPAGIIFFAGSSTAGINRNY